MRQPGFVYVLRLAAHVPGLLKIGWTSGTVDEKFKIDRRAGELSDHTGVAGQYEIVSARHFSQGQVAEAHVHSLLDEYRYSGEFFWIPDLALIEDAFDRVEAQKLTDHPFRAASFHISQGDRYAFDLKIHAKSGFARPLRDYARGRKYWWLSPDKADRLLRRAAGVLLPPALSGEPQYLPRALRVLAELHGFDAFEQPYGPGPARPHARYPDRSAEYRDVAQVAGLLEQAARLGDDLAWGKLGQHHLARGETAGEEVAFQNFFEALTRQLGPWISDRVSRMSNIFRHEYHSPPYSPQQLGSRNELKNLMQILAGYVEAVRVGKLMSLNPLLKDMEPYLRQAAGINHISASASLYAAVLSAFDAEKAR